MSRAGDIAFEQSRHVFDGLGEVIALVDHPHAHHAGAVDDGAADRADGQRLEQNGEPVAVLFLRDDSAQRHAVLEAILVGGRGYDRAGDAEHIEPFAVRAGVVADQDDASLADVALGVAASIALPLLKIPCRVDEGIERRRRDGQRIAGSNFA